MQTHLDSLLRRLPIHAAQEAPGGQKQAAVVVILADHQRRAVEEKAKLAELIAESEFLQLRQLAENKAEQLRVQEKLAKAKARSQVYEEMEERMPLNPKEERSWT